MNVHIEDRRLLPIREKVEAGLRLSYDDGVALYRTHDLLASFEVSLDDAGNIQRWRRTGRFVRCQQVEG